MNILFSWLSIPRAIGIWIDTIAFSLIDNAYNLIVYFAGATLFKDGTVTKIMSSTYIIISIFALFRLALLLINAMINPDRLYDSNVGVVKIGLNVIVMLVLLVVTPTIFKMSREFQSFVVKGNYIGKMFGLGIADFSSYVDYDDSDRITPGGSSEKTDDDGYNPGILMQKMVINSLIFPDERLVDDDGNPNDDCNSNSKCESIVNDYNKMMSNDNNYRVDYAWLSRKITVSLDVDDEEVYVLHYYFVVTLLVAGFIAYILFSFAIDIAVRSVDLAVLEILSPLFIVTYIDPTSAKSGAFHKWLKEVTKTYTSLFIKLAIVSLMLVLVTLINDFEIKGGNFLAKILMVFAVLIFAKKAPSWLGKMTGMGDGEGAGGLSIAKKLGSAALIGGAVSKGLGSAKNAAKNKALEPGRRIAGAATGAVKNAMATRKVMKDKLDSEGKTFSAGYHENRQDMGRVKSATRAAKSYFKDTNQRKENAKAMASAMAAGAAVGGYAGFKDTKGAKSLSEVKTKTDATAKATIDKYSGAYQTHAQQIKDDKLQAKQDKMYGVLGTDAQLSERISEKNKAEKAKADDKKARMYFPNSVDSNGNRTAAPIKVSQMRKVLDDSNAKLESAGVKLSGSSVEGLMGAMTLSKVLKNGDTFSYNGNAVKLFSDGIEMNGVKKSYSQFCVDEGIVSTAGQRALESFSHEIAVQNASRYSSNIQAIAEQKELSSKASQQILSVQSSIKSVAGDEALQKVLRLDEAQKANIGSSITTREVYMDSKNKLVAGFGDEMIVAETSLDELYKKLVDAKKSGETSEKIVELQYNIDEAIKNRDVVRKDITEKSKTEIKTLQTELTTARSNGETEEKIIEIEEKLKKAVEKYNEFEKLVKEVDAYEDLYGYIDAKGVELKEGAIKAVDSISGLQEGFSKAYMDITAARDDALSKVDELIKENETISDEIIKDIEENKEKSLYNPEDYDGTGLKFIKDGKFVQGEELSRIISRMENAKSKADEALNKVIPKDNK